MVKKASPPAVAGAPAGGQGGARPPAPRPVGQACHRRNPTISSTAGTDRAGACHSRGGYLVVGVKEPRHARAGLSATASPPSSGSTTTTSPTSARSSRRIARPSSRSRGCPGSARTRRDVPRDVVLGGQAGRDGRRGLRAVHAARRSRWRSTRAPRRACSPSVLGGQDAALPDDVHARGAVRARDARPRAEADGLREEIVRRWGRAR